MHGCTFLGFQGLEYGELISHGFEISTSAYVDIEKLVRQTVSERSDGTPLIRGVRLNAFTDAEEQQVGLAETVPFLLESRLKEMGAKAVWLAGKAMDIADIDRAIHMRSNALDELSEAHRILGVSQ